MYSARCLLQAFLAVLITQSSSEYSISFCIESADKVKARNKCCQMRFELELKDGFGIRAS
ncbi:hypothetical protein O9993_07970 [Vibrio lentus]|nr:hypothetical protein [Vibrio lentus]